MSPSRLTHPCPLGGRPHVGPEVARDEVVQAEPSWEAAGWGLHAWVKVGRLWASRRLLWVSSVGQEGGRESLAGPNIGGRGGDSCGRGSAPAGWALRDPGNRPLGHPPAGCQCLLPEVQWAAC